LEYALCIEVYICPVVVCFEERRTAAGQMRLNTYEKERTLRNNVTIFFIEFIL
jgi:hypothetical protein